MKVIKHQWQIAIGTSAVAIRKIWMTLFKAQIILKFHKYRINWKSNYSFFVLFPNLAVLLAHDSPMMYNNYNERLCIEELVRSNGNKYKNIVTFFKENYPLFLFSPWFIAYETYCLKFVVILSYFIYVQIILLSKF